MNFIDLSISQAYTNLVALGIGSMRVEGTTVYFTITKTGEEVSVTLPTPADGKSLEFNWQGTKLGVKVQGDANFTYVDLKGEKGTTNYNELTNLPTINGVELQGNKTASDLGIVGSISTEIKTALLNCFKNVAWTSTNGQSLYTALETALNSASSNGGSTDSPSGGTTEDSEPETPPTEDDTNDTNVYTYADTIGADVTEGAFTWQAHKAIDKATGEIIDSETNSLSPIFFVPNGGELHLPDVYTASVLALYSTPTTFKTASNFPATSNGYISNNKGKDYYYRFSVRTEDIQTNPTTFTRGA